MTDRHAAYLVVLEDDIREDDAEATLNALMQIKGVIGVQPVSDAGAEIMIARIRESTRWQHRVFELLREMKETAS
jgi:hypothetical protein